MVSKQELQRLFTYDPDSGQLIRKKKWGGRTRTKVRYYPRIRLNGKQHRAHVLVWTYHNGPPTGIIDHKDGDKNNGRIENLRDVSARVNTENQRKPHRGNKSGYLGVTFVPSSSRFLAQIKYGGAVHYLGSFGSAEEAHKCYLESKRLHHEGCTI